MRCLIADDEEHARAHLKGLLSAHSGLTVVSEVGSGVAALEAVRQQEIDLAFLDIEMPGSSGLEVARAFSRLLQPPVIIFLTAHSDHAVDAYELGVLDYLLKPVQPDRLWQALMRLENRDVGQAASGDAAGWDKVWVTHPVSRVQEVVSLDEISYFTASDDQVWAEVRGETYRVGLSLARLEDVLAQRGFVRTHKAFLVNLDKVRRVIPLSHRVQTLVLDNGREIPLSRHYLGAFRERVPGL